MNEMDAKALHELRRQASLVRAHSKLLRDDSRQLLAKVRSTRRNGKSPRAK